MGNNPSTPATKSTGGVLTGEARNQHDVSAQQQRTGAPLVRRGDQFPLPPPPADGINTVKKVFLDDVKMIDAKHSTRMPPLIKSEVDKAVDRDATRICYETEKIMARCCQDKLYTVYKCQKERDAYYACTRKYRTDPEVINMMRWKYNLGTFHGEIVARRRLMRALWQEYFPDQEINHEWAQE
jgi:hypothetical protein